MPDCRILCFLHKLLSRKHRAKTARPALFATRPYQPWPALRERLVKMLLAALRSADLLPPVLTIECLAASPDVGCAVLTVTRPVEAGELLLELPGTAALTKDSAQDTSLLQYLDPEDGRPPPGMPHWAALPDDFVLALQLLQLQRARGDRPDDPWGAWLRLAPKQLHGTAHWGEDEREWLTASFMEEHTRLAPAPPHELLQALRAHDAAYFEDDGGAFSPEALDRAAALVRAHRLVPPQTGVPLLLPLPQLRLEHGGAARLSQRAADGRLELRAARALRAGAEVTLDAGSFGHAALMLRQGTPGEGGGGGGGGGGGALWTNEAGASAAAGPGALPLSLALAEDDGMHALKLVLLGKLGLKPEGEGFLLRQGRPPPPTLMPFARLLVLQVRGYP